jgi:hypothetical protein
MKTLEDRMKGVCLDCQAEFAWARFMQGNKLCVLCTKQRLVPLLFKSTTKEST